MHSIEYVYDAPSWDILGKTFETHNILLGENIITKHSIYIMILPL